MTKEFETLDKFARHMQKVVKNHSFYEIKAMSFLGEELVEKAKDTIGHLQQGEGQFKTWAPLAESTKSDKERLGYVFNDEYNPLLRTGELRESIKFDFDPILHKLRLGSNDEIMVYQELGTKYIPPRSVLGLTMFKATPEIALALQNMISVWLDGGIWRNKHGSI